MISHHIHCRKWQEDSLDFIGRQPTHRPSQVPWGPEDDGYYGFFLQLWVDGVRLKVPNTLCLQFYQPMDDGDDPSPFIVPIRPGDALNTEQNITLKEEYGAWSLVFEEAQEADVLPDEASQEILEYFHSKLGGHNPWQDVIEAPGVYLGQISENLAPMKFGLNFGGVSHVLYLDPEGNVVSVGS